MVRAPSATSPGHQPAAVRLVCLESLERGASPSLWRTQPLINQSDLEISIVRLVSLGPGQEHPQTPALPARQVNKTGRNGNEHWRSAR
ncbi:uncharacterized protein NCU07122 [Neurospora crassa OR74A]|uniref:Uncharacterized protein n=1 Tax=Neurospora crassa (strain ATCC 24698 / 74-OR23-1A / CBS 708.71 / DSM 1257 / FGSC 987) TaxID=367110 RepID=V5IMY3_NEUCR|nr:uncharacterized protein NCU07122 [Neurospora crassa OR74A]ESA42091.1 hypothetical protein, variant [Neurospora crassa OR74A]|eukprot:XP_011395007.1 uncharacterized protein NCU07122 [Neurospora crassa OR74A]